MRSREVPLACEFLTDLIPEPPLVLASGSPRRRSILTGLGVAYVAEVTGLPEDALDGEAPARHVERLAAAKAGASARRRPA